MFLPLRVAAPAKLNLYLHVTGRRADGFHLLDSLMAFTEFGDVLEISPGKGLTLEVTGPFAVPADEHNLVLRAARALQKTAGTSAGAHMVLHKHIPVGAGLGGGSADAAAALRGLRRLWNLSIEDAALQSLALTLGSDVPVCVTSHAAWVQGIGENITPVRLPEGVWAVLTNPRMPLLTADVFRGFAGAFDAPPQHAPTADDLIPCLAARHNALEAPAIALMPVIAEILAALRATTGCRLARMSGSGATCFALYDNESATRQACDEMRTLHPTWWSVATSLLKEKL